jgi:vitamin-K-epoxide reductase (warfarin-sensitive)
MKDVPRVILVAIALLALAGMAVSSVALVHHYGHSPSSYCDFGQSFNCDMVNRSRYSTLAGIPVALIGLLGYLGILALVTLYRKRPESRALLFFGALAGVAFALYLTYIEALVLAVWCILCVSSLVIIVSIAALSSLVFLRYRTTPSEPR